jgi:uncharacterized protein (DUF3084 family)
MSDALTAASMISNTLHAYQIGDMFTAARVRHNNGRDIAALQGLVQRLADYGRYIEQQHNSLLADAKKLDAERLRQIDAQQQEIAQLREERASARESAQVLGKQGYKYLKLHDELVSRVAALEAENAKLRQASSSD